MKTHNNKTFQQKKYDNHYRHLDHEDEKDSETRNHSSGKDPPFRQTFKKGDENKKLVKQYISVFVSFHFHYY